MNVKVDKTFHFSEIEPKEDYGIKSNEISVLPASQLSYFMLPKRKKKKWLLEHRISSK